MRLRGRSDPARPERPGARKAPIWPRRPGARRRKRSSARPYLYLLPALAFLGLFVYAPVALVVALSFFDWNMVSPSAEFVGPANFTALLSSVDFFRILLQSLLYVVLALAGGFLLPVGLAMLTLRVGGRASGLYQGLLFTPTVVATAVGAILWQFVYLPTGGPLNEALSVVGLPGANWLGDPRTALPAVGVMAAWKHLGSTT